MTGASIVVGRCYGCGRIFGFNPHHVPSVPVDPMTSLPPDVGEDGEQVEPDPAAVERARREPLCGDCAARMNAAREARGLEPFPIHPEAYEPVEGFL